MSIENPHFPKKPDSLPKSSTQQGAEGPTVVAPSTAYELLGGVPGDSAASAKGFRYPVSSGPEAAWTQEQIDSFDPTTKIDPTDLSYLHTTTTENPTTQDLEAKTTTSPFKNFLKKPLGKISAIAAGTLLVGSLGVGIGANVSANKNEANTPPAPDDKVTSGPETPGVTTPPPEQIENVPTEAKDFVEKYANYYADPVSTFYADKAYANVPGIAGFSTIIDLESIKDYEPTDTISQENSPFGFAPAYAFPEVMPNTETVTEMYNKFFIPWGLESYMNQVARNPSVAARAVLDNQFMKFTGSMSSFKEGEERETQRARVQNLLDHLKGIVDTYGTTAVFDIAEATNQLNDTSKTTIDNGIIQGLNEDKEIKKYSTTVDLRINVTVYNGAVPTQSDLTAQLPQMLLTWEKKHDDVDPVRVGLSAF